MAGWTLTSPDSDGGSLPQYVLEQGGLLYSTKARMDADLDHDEPSLALVYADPDETLNGTYIKSGATGEGSWAGIETLSLATVTPAGVSATTYTLSTADKGKSITFTADTAVAVTVPAGLGDDFICGLRQGGLGQITVGASGGAAVRNKDGQYKTQAQLVRLVLMADSILGTDVLVLEGATA